MWREVIEDAETKPDGKAAAEGGPPENDLS